MDDLTPKERADRILKLRTDVVRHHEIIYHINQAIDDDRRPLRILVGTQAMDDGLWFEAETAPEAYLQQELRALHAAIERKTPEECVRDILANAKELDHAF